MLHIHFQIHWITTEPGEDLCLYSISLDGRLTQWLVHDSILLHTDILHFEANQNDLPAAPHTTASSTASIHGDKIMLDGIAVPILYVQTRVDSLCAEGVFGLSDFFSNETGLMTSYM